MPARAERDLPIGSWPARVRSAMQRRCASNRADLRKRSTCSAEVADRSRSSYRERGENTSGSRRRAIDTRSEPSKLPDLRKRASGRAAGCQIGMPRELPEILSNNGLVCALAADRPSLIWRKHLDLGRAEDLGGVGLRSLTAQRERNECERDNE